jgi:AraC-like DNA-binding protein
MKASQSNDSIDAGAKRLTLAPWVLRRVGKYLDDHIGDNVQLDDLAKLASVSRFHFARCFRISTGETPMGFLRRRRIERAMQLLERGDRPISDIAVELGFYDQSHFTRHFTRIVGTTPGRFARRELRRPNQASTDVAA